MANTLIERARQAIGDAIVAKRDRLASFDPDFDDADEIAAHEAVDPHKALVETTVKELREFLQANKPGDSPELRTQRDLWRVRAESIRQRPDGRTVHVQACDLIALVDLPRKTLAAAKPVANAKTSEAA